MSIHGLTLFKINPPYSQEGSKIPGKMLQITIMHSLKPVYESNVSTLVYKALTS